MGTAVSMVIIYQGKDEQKNISPAFQHGNLQEHPGVHTIVDIQIASYSDISARAQFACKRQIPTNLEKGGTECPVSIA